MPVHEPATPQARTAGMHRSSRSSSACLGEAQPHALVGQGFIALQVWQAANDGYVRPCKRLLLWHTDGGYAGQLPVRARSIQVEQTRSTQIFNFRVIIKAINYLVFWHLHDFQ